jgi:hypothetical protein
MGMETRRNKTMAEDTAAAFAPAAATARATAGAAVNASRVTAAPARRARRGTRTADLAERFTEEILSTFGPRWEW